MWGKQSGGAKHQAFRPRFLRAFPLTTIESTSTPTCSCVRALSIVKMGKEKNHINLVVIGHVGEYEIR
jgi:hypothetical protein